MIFTRQTAGFTLIEVLIGTTLLAIMLTLLSSALFTVTHGARAGESSLEDLDAKQLVHAFLRRQLQGAVPLTERIDGESHILFEGRPDRLRLVGHLPLSAGGGLHFLEFSAVDDSLEMHYELAWPDTAFSSTESAWTRRTLLSGIERLRLRYFGARDADSSRAWTSEWIGGDRLPELIELKIEEGQDHVTTLTAEVRVRTAVAQAPLFRQPPDRTQ